MNTTQQLATGDSYSMRYITVWEFRSIDGTQVVKVVRPSYPDDYKFQHEFQRILYRGPQASLDSSKVF